MLLSHLLRLLIIIFFCSQNISCGTLGGLDDRVFLVSKKKIENAIDSLYANNPQYRTPGKWLVYDDWSERGYNFLESRIFYFESSPEEMYYISFVGASASPADTFTCTLAVRAVFKEEEGRWYTEEDFNLQEQKRIENRFDKEIISKIESYANAKSRRK